MSARAASAPPDIPGYRHLELLGMGGFADVFLYEQRSMGGRKVAVKVLLQGLRGDLQQAFEDEARAMARLSNHPSIVSVFDAGQTPDGRAYLVMEHCPGAHLGTQVKSRPLNLAKALEVAIQVSGAVETAHAASIVHRDIKPANILFTEFNRPALTDFGISASTTAVQGKAVGVSVPWAPPEQLAAGSQTGVTGDVYSLGATLYTALVGHPPFWKPQGPNDNMSMSSRIVNDLLPPIHREDAPPSLQRVLEVAMSKRPSQRYPTALEFARALQQVQLELHLPVTAADVRAELAQVAVDDETEAGGTIAAGFVTIEATPTKSATDFDSRSGSGFTGGTAHVNTTDLERDGLIPQVIRHGRGSAESLGPIEFTGPVPLSVDDGHTILSTQFSGPEAADADLAPAAPPKRRAALWAVLAVIVLVLAIGAIVLIPKGSGDAGTQRAGTTTPSVKPVDPVGEVVPQVTDLKVVNDAGTVTVTWTNPSPSPADHYLYRVVDPAVTNKSYETTTDTKATVKAIPGRTCVEVMLVRSNGRSSDPVPVCVAT
jgi:serine/threonine protein kinase